MRERCGFADACPYVSTHYGTTHRLTGLEDCMDWLAKYWWILVLVFLLGVILNVIKDLNRVDHKKFLANKPELPPHRDFNDKWDDEDDWPKKDQPKK
ncbi:Hypothetical protein AKI40_1400 [Enterobacter sp. FY-07]|nr:Hypothetical protein AKI40_1400 [Enterobacter sp. FY-07]